MYPMVATTRCRSIVTHSLGFPRVGVQRELKKALEGYWNGTVVVDTLLKTGKELRRRHRQQQADRGIDLLPVGDFHWYDHVLGTSLMLGNIPPRHQAQGSPVNVDTLFRIARGFTSNGVPIDAAEMTKWFNTNYHYIVPEFTSPAQTFSLSWNQLFEEIEELLSICGPFRTKPVILGPVTYVWLGKVRGGDQFDRCSLLPRVVSVYAEVLERIASSGIQWVQLDEPILGLDLDKRWLNAFEVTYRELRRQAGDAPRLLLATYFESVAHNLDVIRRLAVNGLHVDVVSGGDNLLEVEKRLPASWVLSAGVINGRNVWRADLSQIYERLGALRHAAPGRMLWIGTSCSLLHCPIDLDCEVGMDKRVWGSLAFALQKCDELSLLATALKTGKEVSRLTQYGLPVQRCKASGCMINAEVRKRVSELRPEDAERSVPYPKRAEIQRETLKLPLVPTTTIGSLPRTPEMRSQSVSFREGLVDEATYRWHIEDYIKHAVREQEAVGLDILVHGEPERNDMVEYFAEMLNGFVNTKNGWVQSYGSRCVKPPIIYGDVSRPRAMTVEWITYAQSLTQKPIKGILTGPTTMVRWSFVREDLPERDVARQIALVLRDEVSDLQNAGIRLIQVDEPAFREGLPLRKGKHETYLKWATEAFKIVVAVAQPETQVHTHICYSEVHEIIKDIAALDADVTFLEASRSDMELLRASDYLKCLNGVGLGLYDVHSPNVPTVQSITKRLTACAQQIAVDRLWANPDCGLKTREWEETRKALHNMVEGALRFRRRVSGHGCLPR